MGVLVLPGSRARIVRCGGRYAMGVLVQAETMTCYNFTDFGCVQNEHYNCYNMISIINKRSK